VLGRFHHHFFVAFAMNDEFAPGNNVAAFKYLAHVDLSVSFFIQTQAKLVP
jgi:hypothetical protein